MIRDIYKLQNTCFNTADKHDSTKCLRFKISGDFPVSKDKPVVVSMLR